MRRLLLRGALLAAPFLLLAAFVAIVDPFDYFGPSRVLSDAVKRDTAGRLHYPLLKVHQFRREPVSRILLGDSRMFLLDVGSIEAVSGERYFNFAYGGGTLTEAVKTYWLASRTIHLDAVYLEMGLINFNAYQNLDRVSEVEAMDGKPLMYLSNRLVVHAAILAAYVAATGAKVNLEAPPMEPAAFWRFQIDQALPQALHLYAYPNDVAEQLRAMAADCRKNGTRLVIVIPPTHIDVQEKTAQLGRTSELARFREFAATLGAVYDFDYPNALTADRSKFSDPLHLTNSDEIVRNIWGAEQRYVRVTP